jgi:hypothetical protein
MRPLCQQCQKKPCAVNYHKDDRTFYRKVCDSCARDAKVKQPRWQQSGYQKKLYCEKCGYKSKYPEQFDVYHIDESLDNCRPGNLKTVCANCQRSLYRDGVRWRQGDLEPDF